jgi:hypothetical protein
MSSSPESANPVLPAPQAAAESLRASRTPNSDDLPYMMLTVVAILVLLGSLWIF